MPLLVIDCVKFFGWYEPSILTFTNRHGQNIGDNPQDADSAGNEDKGSVVEYPTNTPGVALDSEIAKLTGVDPDFCVEPKGMVQANVGHKEIFLTSSYGYVAYNFYI
jgi:hypothetical protein